MTEAIQPPPNSVGRPTDLTPDVRLKIEEAAALDATVEEMALYAGVHRSTLYRWIKENEELSDRIEELRQKPVLKARNTIIQSLNDPNVAFRYLERKRAKEFMPTAKLEHAGQVAFTPGSVDPRAEEIKNKYEDDLRKVLADGDEESPNQPVVTPQVEKNNDQNHSGPVDSGSEALPG